MAERGKKPGRDRKIQRTLSYALARTTQGIARDLGAGIVMLSPTLLVVSEDSIFVSLKAHILKSSEPA